MKIYILSHGPIASGKDFYASKISADKGRLYDGQKDNRLVDRISVTNQHGTLPLLCGPLMLHVQFYMPIPRNSHILPERVYHIYRPKLSRLVNWIEDLCVGIVFKDTAIIASLNATKVYDRKPRTEFYFTQLLTPEENRREQNKIPNFKQIYKSTLRSQKSS